VWVAICSRRSSTRIGWTQRRFCSPPNTQTATLWAFLNLNDGPTVVEVPPGVLGLAEDLWMRYIIDLGLAGYRLSLRGGAKTCLLARMR